MIKRFNPDFSLSISHELAYMRETPEGGYADYRDYASLFSELELVRAERDRLQQLNEQTLQVKLQMAETIKAQSEQVNDLAVENAALKSSVDLIASAYTEGEPAGFEIDRARNIKTPATDAALAAIRADAMAEGAEACVRALVTSDDDDFSDAPNICAMVARQLREAK